MAMERVEKSNSLVFLQHSWPGIIFVEIRESKSSPVYNLFGILRLDIILR